VRNWFCCLPEQGNAVLITLMVLMVLTVLGTTVIEVGSMEYKISRYDYEYQQAQLAADAGVEWSAEQVYLAIAEYQRVIEVPYYINLSHTTDPVAIGSIPGQTLSPSFSVTNWRANRVSMTSDRFVFSLDCAGTYGRARKSIRVGITYTFDLSGFEPNYEMNLSNRGVISSYEVISNP
jgi:hypothetical protein